MAEATLTRVWEDFCSKLNISRDLKDKWLQLIKTEYEERPFYDLNYLTNKLLNFESCRNNLKEPDVFLLALIFQSISYVSHSGSNLEKCLEKFGEFALEVNLDKTQCDLTKQLIELSVTNTSEEFWEDGTFGNEDAHYFLDINFAHLAQDWDEYKAFSVKTRNEYNFLNEESYKALRKKILQSFLHIPNIYATAKFRNELETKARGNIEREIEESI